MKTKNLTQALRELIAAIDLGMEYPEAHWATIDMFNLTTKEGETLTNLYDECGGNLNHDQKTLHRNRQSHPGRQRQGQHHQRPRL